MENNTKTFQNTKKKNNLMHMPNTKPLDPPLSSVTQGILWLGKNGTYKGNHITTTSLKSPRLYTLICKSYNILKNWQHIIGMVIPGMLILKNLIMSWPGWTFRSVWCHDRRDTLYN